MKWFRTVLLYLPGLGLFAALAFLAAFDWPADFLELHWGPLILSVAMLLGFFAVRALLWQRLLCAQALPCSWPLALLSLWRTALVKYLPGKVWIVLGPADIVSRALGRPLGQVSFVALAQIGLSVWAGITLGLPLLVKATGLPWAVALGVGGASLGLGWWALSRQALLLRKLPLGLGKRLAGKLAPVRVHGGCLLLAYGQWLVLGGAFVLFFQALGGPLLLSALWWQPLANALGIAVPLSPGGLGVREAVMLFYLSLDGLDWAEASIYVLWARLWFLAVECLSFLISWCLRPPATSSTAAPIL